MAQLTLQEQRALLRNRVYWRNRMIDQQKRITNKSIAEIEKQIAKYYANCSKRVMRDFEATFDKLIATVGAGKEATPADLYKLQKYWEMQGQLKIELQKLGDKSINLLQKRFVAQFQNVYNSLNLPITTAFTTIDDAAAMHIVNAVWCADGLNWSQRIWKNNENLVEALNGSLAQCIVTGKKTSALKKMLQDNFNATHYEADRLVRTECAHIQTQAARQRYQDAGITQMEVWVDEDERTCPICAKHEGERVNVNQTMPVPFHPNCRCCMIPVIE